MARGEGLRERGLWNQKRVVCIHLGCLAKLMQLVGVGHRLVLLGEGNQQQGEEEWAQPRQLCGALSDDNFCAALRKV